MLKFKQPKYGSGCSEPGRTITVNLGLPLGSPNRKIGGIRTNNRDIFSGNFEILDDYKVLAMEWTKGDKRLTFVCNNGKNWEPFKVVSDSINLLNNRAVLKGNYTLAPFEFMIVKNFNGDVDNI